MKKLTCDDHGQRLFIDGDDLKHKDLTVCQSARVRIGDYPVSRDGYPYLTLGHAINCLNRQSLDLTRG